MHDGMPYGRNQGQGHSREVDRQSPTGLILNLPFDFHITTLGKFFVDILVCNIRIVTKPTICLIIDLATENFTVIRCEHCVVIVPFLSWVTFISILSSNCMCVLCTVSDAGASDTGHIKLIDVYLSSSSILW